MKKNSYGSLRRPIHPYLGANIIEEKRETSINELVETLSSVDQDFMHEQRKQQQHKENLMGSALKMVRSFDYLPRSVVLGCFQRAVKHIYDTNEKALAEQKQIENLIAEDIKNSQETN